MADRYRDQRSFRDTYREDSVLAPRRRFDPKIEPNKILLLHISNPMYPITVEVIQRITSRFGEVLRIVIFKKNGVQAMVEFSSVESAEEAKANLDNCDIYAGCCTLSIEFARTGRLNVPRNNIETGWDFTVEPSLERPEQKRTALLDPPPSDRFRKRQYDEIEETGPYRGGQMQEPRPRYYDEPMPKRSYQGAEGNVIMVYGLDDRMNCNRLFNILCLYGNVEKIRFLKSIEGGAMVQMADNKSVARAISHLSNEMLFGKKLQIRLSKQSEVQDIPNPGSLKDGTPSFKSYIGSKNNRYNTPEAAAKNRTVGVWEAIHFFNAPANIDEGKIRDLFASAGAPEPESAIVLKSRSERSSTGMINMKSGGDALGAIALVNHTAIESDVPGKFPFVFKMCFAASKGHPKSKEEIDME
ncbi:heterogeneous nuclear ribonucleoprotein L-like isoform X4 [Artemia franciscana]|uniref:heterogeneous nuclear ribonucleoprotein L-like isoform X4 n=1 Tax=Artemia franciscana TaxID=6661 RepID=UPI0032DA512F